MGEPSRVTVTEVARLLILFGAVAVVLGILMILGAKIPLLGRLPGDFFIDRGGTKIYIPLATSLLLSLILSFLLNLFWH